MPIQTKSKKVELTLNQRIARGLKLRGVDYLILVERLVKDGQMDREQADLTLLWYYS
jgi:hypothetical protein